jgi:hypothetical protein
LSACRTFPGLIDPLQSLSFCNSNLASRYSLAIFGLMTNPYSSATARDHSSLQMLGLSSALQFVIEGVAIALGMAVSRIDPARARFYLSRIGELGRASLSSHRAG